MLLKRYLKKKKGFNVDKHDPVDNILRYPQKYIIRIDHYNDIISW